ncbi:MAG: phospho-sugar glycosidase domain-containing protein, partial [Erysipelotrichaceae bacterium]|nr:phospho-sugar glycosidase domain-containing protein [Erysipelotrichaceae bacterium]
QLLFEFTKHNVSEYTHTIIRSRWGRMDFRFTPIAVRKCDKEYFENGDVLIINESNPRYKGEVHIARKPIRNDGSMNYAGRIKEEELFLLDHLHYFMNFGFIEE